jgi:hypothetical protein
MDIETAIRTNNREELSKFSKGEIAIRCLEMLTPQGSEFYNDPIRCFEHIQQRFDDSHKRIVGLIKKK